MSISDLTTDVLQECLSGLGIFKKKIPNGAEVTLLGSRSACLVDISQVEAGNGGFSAVANVRIDLGSGGIVEDLLIGCGVTAPEAIASAIDQFVGSMVAPIAGLAKNFDLGAWRCRVTNFEMPCGSGDVGWNMIIGQVVSNDAGGELYSLADEQPPLLNVFAPLAQDICDSGDDPKPHWIKVYLCRYPGEIDGEVRIDNHLNEQALHILRSYRWPSKQPFIWFRQFAFLEPADQTERRWLVESQRK